MLLVIGISLEKEEVIGISLKKQILCIPSKQLSYCNADLSAKRHYRFVVSVATIHGQHLMPKGMICISWTFKVIPKSCDIKSYYQQWHSMIISC